MYDVYTIVVAVGKLNTEPLLIASQDVPKKDVPPSLVGNSEIVFFESTDTYGADKSLKHQIIMLISLRNAPGEYV